MSTDESVRAGSADGTADGQATPEPSRRRAGSGRKTRPESTAEVAGDRAAERVEQDDESSPDPRFWHRNHPVFTPLSGFFTGVLTVVVVLGLLGAILDLVIGYDVSEHPWVFLVALGVLLVLNLVLVVVGSTRRFARYMLFGILTTPTVVFAVASLTFWFLLQNDS